MATSKAINATPKIARYETINPIGGFMQNYQQLDAEIAQYEAEAKLIKQRAKDLRKQRESMAKQERDGAVPEIVTLMLTLGITLDQVRTAFAAAKSVVAPAIHKYWNPETGETHSGKGSCPGWLTPEAKKDPRYLNPEWVANDEAKKAAKKAEKNNAESSRAAVVTEAPASNDAATVSNNEIPASNGNATMTVASVAEVDANHGGYESYNEAVVSNLS